MARWRAKQLWMYPFTRTRVGEDLYEWLTAAVLGTQRGMSRKWCYWFREHVVLGRRFGAIEWPGRRLWLFQPGWSLAPVILGHLVTGEAVLVTEDRRRLAKRYVGPALAETAKVAQRVCRSAGAPIPSPSIVEALGCQPSPDGILSACKAQYRAAGVGDLASLPTASADACFSMGRLEHFGPVQLRTLLCDMHRVLAPGGIGSHIVDHRDHYWHYDKSIHCFHHLTFSDAQWARIAQGRKAYRNRLLEPDYVALFQQAGFDVLARIHDLHRSDADGVDPTSLWGPFASLTRDDLSAAVSHFVVRRR